MGLFSRNESALDSASEITIITEGMTISGEIAVTGSIYINGTFTGKIVAKGEISIGPKGKLHGQIRAASLRVAGLIDGTTVCTTLRILATGKAYGAICSSSLEIHPGGFIDAEHCSSETLLPRPEPEIDAVAERDAVVTPLHAAREPSRPRALPNQATARRRSRHSASTSITTSSSTKPSSREALRLQQVHSLQAVWYSRDPTAFSLLIL